MDDVQGSVGFFFHEGRDKYGMPGTKVFGASNCHVLREKIEELAHLASMFELTGSVASRGPDEIKVLQRDARRPLRQGDC